MPPLASSEAAESSSPLLHTSTGAGHDCMPTGATIHHPPSELGRTEAPFRSHPHIIYLIHALVGQAPDDHRHDRPHPTPSRLAARPTSPLTPLPGPALHPSHLLSSVPRARRNQASSETIPWLRSPTSSSDMHVRSELNHTPTEPSPPSFPRTRLTQTSACNALSDPARHPRSPRVGERFVLRPSPLAMPCAYHADHPYKLGLTDLPRAHHRPPLDRHATAQVYRLAHQPPSSPTGDTIGEVAPTTPRETALPELSKITSTTVRNASPSGHSFPSLIYPSRVLPPPCSRTGDRHTKGRHPPYITLKSPTH